jgi:hypothetical protein
MVALVVAWRRQQQQKRCGASLAWWWWWQQQLVCSGSATVVAMAMGQQGDGGDGGTWLWQLGSGAVTAAAWRRQLCGGGRSTVVPAWHGCGSSDSSLTQFLCRTSQVARLLSSKNYWRRAHIGIYPGIQEVLSSKSNTSSSIDQSEYPINQRRVQSTPSSSFKSGYKQLLRRGAIGSNHRSPGTTLK